MISTPVLTSYDGSGYGKSMNWHYLAIKIAKKNTEACNHLDIHKILIFLAPIENGSGDKMKFTVTCSSCNANFAKTSEKLTLKFLKFYGK